MKIKFLCWSYNHDTFSQNYSIGVMCIAIGNGHNEQFKYWVRFLKFWIQSFSFSKIGWFSIVYYIPIAGEEEWQ